MPRVPVVPIPDLAVAFVESVAAGVPPVREMAQRFDLTPEQASARSWRLRKGGWLPPGEYTEDGWLQLAQAMVSSRLEELMEREIAARAQLAGRLQRARAAVEREQEQQRAQRLPAQVRMKTPRAAREVSRGARGGGSVLDVFG